MNPDNKYPEFYEIARKALMRLYNQRIIDINWISFNCYTSFYFTKTNNLKLEDKAEKCAKDFFESNSSNAQYGKVQRALFSW